MTSTFNIGTQNAGVVQNVGGDLVVHGDVTGTATWQAEVQGAVEQVRREADALPLPRAHRTAVDAALGAAADEAAKPQPERGRIRQLLAAATHTLTDAGALVGAGTGFLHALQAALALL